MFSICLIDLKDQTNGSGMTSRQLALATSTVNQPTLSASVGLNLPVLQAGSTIFSIGLAKANYALDLELSALAADGDAEVLARPRIVTTDKSPAFIESGVKFPFKRPAAAVLHLQHLKMPY